MKKVVLCVRKGGKKLKTELVRGNLLFVVLPLVLVSVVAFFIYRRTLLDEGRHYSERLVAQLTRSLNSYTEDMVNVSILPLYDEDVLHVLRDSRKYYIDRQYEQMYQVEKLGNFLFMLDNLRSEINGVFIYCEDGRVFHNIRGRGRIGQYNYNSAYDYKASGWYERAKAADGKSVVVAPHPQEQVLPGDDTVFSVAKLIKDPQTGRELGAILIDAHLSQIEQICASMLYRPSEHIVILDAEGAIVYSSANNRAFSLRLAEMPVPEGIVSSFTKVDGETYLITAAAQQYTGWRTARFASMDSLLAPSALMGRWIVLLLGVCLLVETLVIVRTADRVTVPIHEMEGRMREVQNGDLTVRIQTKADNEIGRLGESFNEMAEKLQELLWETYVLELEKREAHLAALQSQINPHFLYNTLDSIHMMAELNGDYPVSEMITSLAKMMRYTINGRGEVVTVREELSYLRSYMALQRVRYENGIVFREEVEPALLEQTVFRLLFQPLVENCIQHGYRNGKPCNITLRGENKEGRAVFTVEDDGAGMTPPRLAEIRNMAASPQKGGDAASIGLANIAWRLRWYYGDGYGLHIDSALRNGTCVRVELPLRE